MHKSLLIPLGIAIVIEIASLTCSLAANSHVTAISPLESFYIGPTDKAGGHRPHLRFSSAPEGLSPACAGSIEAQINDGDLVGYPSARTLSEFRSVISGRPQLDPNEAERATPLVNFALSGEGQISGAMCSNTRLGPNARGYCFGTISGGDHTVIYWFDPVPCHYDNVTVAKSLTMRMTVSLEDDRSSKLDCATGLKNFVADIDNLLARDPHNIKDVDEVLNRHFPLHYCDLEAASDIVKTSKFFRVSKMNGPKTRVFEFNSETRSSRGVWVSFGLTNEGNSAFPSAGWSPPFP